MTNVICDVYLSVLLHPVIRLLSYRSFYDNIKNENSMDES